VTIKNAVFGLCSANVADYLDGNAPLNYETSSLFAEAEKVFGNTILIHPWRVQYEFCRDEENPRITMDDCDLSSLSCLIVRSTSGYEQAISVLVRSLRLCGCTIIDPANRFSGEPASKLMTTIDRYEKGVGSDSYYAFSLPQALSLIQELAARKTFPMLSKPIGGKRGRDVIFLESASAAEDLARAFFQESTAKDTPFFIQPFIAFETEYRVMVVGDRVIGMAKKIKPKGSVAANTALGGKLESWEDKEVAQSALNNVNLEGVLGVDIARDQEGKLHIIEANRAPLWQAFEEATGVRVAAEIIQYARTRSFHEQLSRLDPPWCDFTLEAQGRYLIKTQEDYDAHGIVRELLYHTYGEEPSISMGKLPPIISPMFWETLTGYPHQEVKSLKNPDNHVPKQRYERYLRMGRYWKKIHKIFPIDLRAYRNSLIESYQLQGLSVEKKVADINRRLNGLALFSRSLKKGEWPKLLVIVPDSPEVWPMNESFTVTPHYEVRLFRGEGKAQHKGRLTFSPETDEFMMNLWYEKWRIALEYGRTRPDWPKHLISSNMIHLFEEQCQQFNLGSIDRIRDFLNGIKSSFLNQVTPEPKLYSAFLCHASVDKGAIVRRFHQLCKARGINTWFDEEEVRWGDRVLAKISHGLSKSRTVVVFISKEALKKAWVLEELYDSLTMGISKDRFVLPVLLGLTVEQLQEQQPVLASRHCLAIPFYDPMVAVEPNEVERLVDELERLTRNT